MNDFGVDFGVVAAPDTLRIERTLPGPVERIWSYLTEPSRRATWLAAGAMDLRVGGPVELVFHNSELTGHDDRPPAKYEKYGGETRMAGRVTACEPPYLLSYSWGGEPGGTSEVSFELSERGKDVLLVVTHRRLASRDGMVSVAGGWHAHLDILAARLDGREPESFWPMHTRLEAEYERRIPVTGSMTA